MWGKVPRYVVVVGYHFGAGVSAVLAPSGNANGAFYTHVGCYAHAKLAFKDVGRCCIIVLVGL